MKENSFIQRIFVVTMAIFISVPGIFFFVNNENSIGLQNNSNFIDSFDDEASKRFGLRDELFALFSFLKQDVLGSQIIPHKVIQGQEGWYFLGNDFSQTISELMGLSTFTTNELLAIEKNLLSLQKLVTKQNMKFMVVTVPDKSTIYAENVGWSFKEMHGKRKQFNDLLHAKNIHHIDLTKLLKNQSLRTYYKTDSHWNSYGSLISTIHIFGHPIFAHYMAPQEELYRIKDTSFSTMDLTRMLMKKEKEIDNYYAYKFQTNSVEQNGQSDDIQFESADDSRERHYFNKSKKPVVSIVGDSFCEGLIPYFKEHCGELHVFAKNKFDSSFVINYPSDVLILQVAERNIDKFIDKYWTH